MGPMKKYQSSVAPSLLISAVSLLVGCAAMPPPISMTGPGVASVESKVNSSSGARPTPAPASTPAPAFASAATQQLPDRSANQEAAAGPLKPQTPILQTQRYENLIDRIGAGFSIPELDSPLVKQHERWITRNPEYLNRVFERGGKYLFHIVEELEARNMPTELALLPIVESAFNPQALSKAKAAGLWQFIPSTGRVFELEQNWWLDQRRDVIESTRAALDYLQKLHDLQDNDWFLALASYNWGEGAVLRARKRNAAQKKTNWISSSQDAQRNRTLRSKANRPAKYPCEARRVRCLAA